MIELRRSYGHLAADALERWTPAQWQQFRAALQAEALCDEFPPITDPVARRVAVEVAVRNADGKHAAEQERYWQRVEQAARERWAGGHFVTLSKLVTDARDFVDEVDRQRKAR